MEVMNAYRQLYEYIYHQYNYIGFMASNFEPIDKTKEGKKLDFFGFKKS